MNGLKYLYELGREIRNRKETTQEKKKHGSYWVLKLQSGIVFFHDDYNNWVRALFPNGKHFDYGMDFGGFRDEKVSELNFISSINLVKTEPCVKVSQEYAHFVAYQWYIPKTIKG